MPSDRPDLTELRRVAEQVVHQWNNYDRYRTFGPDPFTGLAEPAQVLLARGYLALAESAAGLREAVRYYFDANGLTCEVNKVKECGQCAVCRVRAALTPEATRER